MEAGDFLYVLAKAQRDTCWLGDRVIFSHVPSVHTDLVTGCMDSGGEGNFNLGLEMQIEWTLKSSSVLYHCCSS